MDVKNAHSVNYSFQNLFFTKILPNMMAIDLLVSGAQNSIIMIIEI